MVAVARIVYARLIPHIQTGWLTTGPETAQLAMYFGADCRRGRRSRSF
jgi:2-iminoacetate synthase ThiH